MRLHPRPDSRAVPAQTPRRAGILYRFGSDEDWAGGPRQPPSGPDSREGEDLPFKVEIWDEAQRSVEQVLAITANGSIGYAAYYAATREFPERYITLRHKDRVLSRWNGREH